MASLPQVEETPEMIENFNTIYKQEQQSEQERLSKSNVEFVKLNPNEVVELYFNRSPETMHRIWKKYIKDDYQTTKEPPTENPESWKEELRFVVYDPIDEQNKILDVSNWTLKKGLLFWLHPHNKAKTDFIEIMRVGEKKDTVYLTRPAGSKEKYYNPKDKSSMQYYSGHIQEEVMQ